MNLLYEGLSLNQNNLGSIESDLLQGNNQIQTIYIKDSKDIFFNPKNTSQNLTFINNTVSEQNNDIMTYYYTTHKYLLNSEEHLKIFSLKKGSRNFVRKNLLKNVLRKELKNNYNDDYINNSGKLNNCIYGSKNNFFNKKNYNDIKQLNNFVFGKNIYISNQVANIGQHSVHNSGNLKGKIIEQNKSNNFSDLSNLNIDNKIQKNIINQIDSPPFIPSNYPKKENELLRKKSEDSLSKDKESDSTSAISEKREDEINNEQKKNEKKMNDEKLEPGDYMVQMFGRRGWICQLCNNFNYETRVKCNRCGVPKKPKRIFEIRQKGEEEHYKEGDWKCYHCKNINYSFRNICNRCKLPKMIPFINNYANQMANQINLPVFKVPPSLYLFNNGKVIGYNNY